MLVVKGQGKGGYIVMKITEFVTPTGAKGNLLSVSSWLQLILGAFVFFIVLATGQKMVSYVPKNPVLDTTFEDTINRPQAARNI